MKEFSFLQRRFFEAGGEELLSEAGSYLDSSRN